MVNINSHKNFIIIKSMNFKIDMFKNFEPNFQEIVQYSFDDDQSVSDLLKQSYKVIL